MSLLNDALKRAKDSQRQDPPSGARPLPPIEARRSGGNGWVLALAAILFLAAIGLFVGVALFKRPAQPVEVAQAPVVSPSPAEPAPAPAPNILPVSNAPIPAPVANVTPASDIVTTAPDTSPLPVTTKENLPLVQGVIFSTTHPVAIVNGRAFNTGDHVGDYQIIQILKTSIVFQRSDGSQVTVKLGQ